MTHAPPGTPQATPGRLDGVLLACALVVLYLLTLPGGVPEADGGEFLTLGLQGGIPHPPGYPAYMVLLRAVLPLRVLVEPLALFCGLSSLLSALAAGLLHRVLLELTTSRMAAMLATWMVFVSTPVWRVSTTVEPFALNLLLASGVVFSSWRLLQGREVARWSALLGLLFGVGVCNHHSLAFLAPPSLVVLVVVAWRTRDRAAVPLFVVGGMMGLLPLGYFLVADRRTLLGWGDWDAPGALIHHLLRMDYGTFQLRGGATQDLPRALVPFLQHLPAVLSWAGLALLAAGVASSLRARGNRAGWLASMAVNVLLAGGVFLGLARMEQDGVAFLILERFHALPVVLLAPWLALGAAWAEQRVRWPAVRMALGVGLAFAHASTQAVTGSRVGELFSRMHAHNALATAPAGALIITASDGDLLALSAGQAEHGWCPDCVITATSLLNLPWHRARLRERVPEFGPGPARDVLLAWSSERVVLLTVAAANDLDIPMPARRPRGPFERLVPADVVQDWGAVIDENLALFGGFAFPPDVTQLNGWEALLLMDYWGCLKRLEEHAVAPNHLIAVRRMIHLLEPGMRSML